jgi:hypothetical protein
VEKNPQKVVENVTGHSSIRDEQISYDVLFLFVFVIFLFAKSTGLKGQYTAKSLSNGKEA